MFKEVIKSNAFTTVAAADYYPNIYGGSFCEDRSFVTTLRALIGPRIPGTNEPFGEGIRFSVSQAIYTKSNIDYYGESRIIRKINESHNVSENGRFTIVDFVGGDEDNKAIMEVVKKSFISTLGDDWHSMEDVTALYRKSFEVLCFINPSMKTVAVFISGMTMRMYHYLQCAVLGMLPWYFDKSKGLTDLEKELVFSLREKTPDKYLECLEKMAKELNFEEKRIRRLLNGIETKIERRELDDLLRQIGAWDTKISEYNNAISDLLRRITDSNIRVLGLQAKIAEKSEDSEILQYFLCNKGLKLAGVDDSVITFEAMGYFSYFDEELVKAVLENRHSYAYYYNESNGISNEDIKELMYAIFVDQEIKMRVCAAYRFDIRGGIEALGGYEYSSSLDNYFPNPHIDRYRCLGGYEAIINSALRDHNYITAIEQCVASCKSLNWADGAVMDKFFDRIVRTNKKCFVLPDGNSVSIKDAIKWLKERSQNEQEEQKETEG